MTKWITAVIVFMALYAIFGLGAKDTQATIIAVLISLVGAAVSYVIAGFLVKKYYKEVEHPEDAV